MNQPTTFYELTRQNTGSALCDSGDIYGYRYQQPPETEETPMVEWDSDGRGVINTAKMLQETFEIHGRFTCWPQELAECILQLAAHTQWDETVERYVTDASILPCGEDEGDVNGDETLSVDERDLLAQWVEDYINANSPDALSEAEDVVNTYNNENNLTQDVLYQPLAWVDGDGYEVFLISTHNGCDIRGGYSDTVLCTVKDKDKENYLTQPVVGYRHTGTFLNGEETTDADTVLTDDYTRGYTNFPTYHLHNDHIWVGALTPDGDKLTVSEFQEHVKAEKPTEGYRLLMVPNEDWDSDWDEDEIPEGVTASIFDIEDLG